MSFLGFGKKLSTEEISKHIAQLASSIKIKAQKVIQCETRARKENNYQLTHNDQEECLYNLDQIEQMVKDATKKAKDRLKHSFV